MPMPDDLRHQLGSRIRDLRKTQGWTQTQMAKRTGMTQSHWSQIECGHLQLQLDTLEIVTRVLSVSLEELFRDVGV